MTLLQYFKLFGFFVYAYMAGYILYKDRKSMLNITCSLLITSFAIWDIRDTFSVGTNITKDTVILLQNISSIGWTGFACLFVCFALIFSKREKLLKNKWFLILNFILPLILIYKQWTIGIASSPVLGAHGWEFAWKETFWTYLFYAYYISYTLLGIYIIYRHGIQTKKIIEKRQSKIMVATVIISLIAGTITDVVLPLFHIHEIPPLGNFISLIFAGGMIYAIGEYGFLVVSPAFAAENIISNMEELLILTDVEGKIINVNNAVINSLKYEQKELTGQSVAILFSENSLMTNLLGKITTGEIVRSSEANLLAKDTSEIPVIFSGSSLKDKRGDIRGIAFIATNIAERKRVEETLRESEEKYHFLVESIPDWIWEVDAKGNYTYASPAVRNILGYTPDEMIGRSTSDLMPEDERQQIGAIFAGIIAKKQPIVALENVNRHRDGRLIVLETSGNPILGHNGELLGYRGIDRDITERKKSENEILINSKRLKALIEILQYPSHSIEDYLDFALNRAIEMTDSKIGFIFFYSEEKKEFVLNSWSSEVMNECKIVEKQTVYQLEKTGIWGEAVRQRKPIIVNDYQMPNPLKKGCPEGHATLYRFLTIPMFENDKIVGVVAVANKKTDYADTDTIQLTILMDIVWKALEKKKSDDALYESEERYRVIMESINLGISMIDVNHKIIMTNNYFANTFKKPPIDFVGKYCYNEFEKREAVCPHCPALLAMESGKSTEVETVGVMDDGSRFNVLLRTTPTYASDGTVSGFIEVAEDITERKRVAEKLQESEENLSTLFASMTEMVATYELVFNENGEAVNYRITDCNKAFSAITGINKKEAIGKLATEVYQTDTPPHLDVLAQVALTGSPCDFTEYSDDIDKYLIISVISTKKNQFSTIATDITIIQKTQEEIKAKNKELENYLYVASHDLRSPLVNIQGFSQRFKKQSDTIKSTIDQCTLETETKQSLSKITNEDIPKTLNFILSNVAKMENLINGLLQISRTGRVVMTIKKIDMNRLIKTIIASNNFQITEFSVKVIIEDLSDCYGDENLLNQLFSNIISNALKYRDPSRQLVIEIACQVQFNKLIYSIKDSGIGIEPRYLEKIWDVFYRVDPGSVVTGEGIGLSLSRRITDKHKGKIWVESEAGKGSVFYVELLRNEFSE
ncbi:MAG: PAS domain S-box protein [Bacteroidales bacterium]|nr:PAS domain S-box protein [Bacteroidales bacterium]